MSSSFVFKGISSINFESFKWCPFPYLMSLVTWQTPFGVQCSHITTRPKAEFGLERVYCTSKTYRVYRVFLTRKCFIVTGGRVDGLTGGRVDGWTDGRLTKRSFNFFLFWDILNAILIYTYIQKKNCPDKYLVGFIFWSSWGVAPTIFKITLLRRHFSKMSLKVDFLEKNNKDFPLK